MTNEEMETEVEREIRMWNENLPAGETHVETGAEREVRMWNENPPPKPGDEPDWLS